MPATRTRTVKPSGGDYTSLSGWEAGEQADIVAADEIRQAECYSMSDTTAVVISGWTTDATRYPRVYTPASERHDGKWNTSKYRLEVTSGTDTEGILTTALYTRIEGLQIQMTGTSGFLVGIKGNIASGDWRVSHCLSRGVLSGTASGYGYFRGNAGTGLWWNNIAYDWVNGAEVCIGFYSDAATLYAYNCTAQNDWAGFYNDGVTYVCKNCLAQDCVDGFDSPPYDASSTNNCSDIASNAPGSNPQTGTVTFVDKANDNFHLAASDMVAKGKGADLSADATLAFSDDIDGQPRVGPWDIGADQFVAPMYHWPMSRP